MTAAGADAPMSHPPLDGAIPWRERLRSSIRREAAIASAEGDISSAGITPAADLELDGATVPLGYKGPLYRTFGNAFSRAFELAVTPTLFGMAGYGLDRWIGIVPVLTTVFVLLAIVGMMTRTWYGYVHDMEALEAAGPWNTRRPAP
jgi:hypothetical protein